MPSNEHTALREIAQLGPKCLINTADLRALLSDYDNLLAEAQKPKRKASKKSKKQEVELPHWLPLEAWEAFLAMRVKIKKPATDYAQKLLVNKLAGFRERGLPPDQILNQSIENSWQDLYAPKNEANWGYGGKPAPDAPATFNGPRRPQNGPRNFRAEQQAQANQDALARLSGLPTFDPNVIDGEVNYVAD